MEDTCAGLNEKQKFGARLTTAREAAGDIGRGWGALWHQCSSRPAVGKREIGPIRHTGSPRRKTLKSQCGLASDGTWRHSFAF